MDHSSHSRKEEEVEKAPANAAPAVTFPEWRPRPQKTPEVYTTPPYVPRTTWSPLLLLNTLFKRPDRINIELTSDEEAALRKEQEANFRRHPTTSLPLLPVHSPSPSPQGNRSGVLVKMSGVADVSSNSSKSARIIPSLPVELQLEMSESVDEELFL